jgi:formylglycine-generating enzyme required for sulfatase activity
MSLIDLEPQKSKQASAAEAISGATEAEQFPSQAHTAFVWEFGAEAHESAGSAYRYALWKTGAPIYRLRRGSRPQYKLAPGKSDGYELANKAADAALVFGKPEPTAHSTAAPPRTPVVERNDKSRQLQPSTVRYWLDVALESWRLAGTIPPQPLLRDGLLLLQAGHNLTDAQRALLLRAALAYGRGALTALRYQTDPERTAYLLRDALLNDEAPLPLSLLWQLKQNDPGAPRWMVFLAGALRTELQVSPEPRRTLARVALAQLASDEPLSSIPVSTTVQGVTVTPTPASWRAWLLLILLVAAAGWMTWRAARTDTPDMAEIPGGIFTIGDAEDAAGMREVSLQPFWIDRAEVTNVMYRQCYYSGVCPWPATDVNATGPAYFVDPTYDRYPVVNVEWAAAEAYCRWRGGRLPSAEEWEVAAGTAFATDRHFRYPWGDHYDPRLANGAAGMAGETRPVGQYHPSGDSSSGAMDMAGNVAEWTLTPGTELADAYIVKGGSYLDNANALRVAAKVEMPQYTRATWLGFRCVRQTPSQTSAPPIPRRP